MFYNCRRTRPQQRQHPSDTPRTRWMLSLLHHPNANMTSQKEFSVLLFRPIGVVEGKGFKNLLKVLEPGYSVPARQTIMHALTAKYEAVKERVITTERGTELDHRYVDVSSSGVLYDSDCPFH